MTPERAICASMAIGDGPLRGKGGPLNPMNIAALLRTADGGILRELDDPAGGTFNAAGGFGELLVSSPSRYRVLNDANVAFGSEEHLTVLDRGQMDDLLVDIDLAMADASDPIMRRGLDRLRVMALLCRDSNEGLYIEIRSSDTLASTLRRRRA
jgi:aryl carrier-like protein